MKKIKWFYLVIGLLLLSGCSLPFSPSAEEEVAVYIDRNEEVILSSNAIDTRVVKSIDSYLANEDDTSEQMENELKKSRDLQQVLYDQLKKEIAPNNNTKIKYLYLQYLNNRIDGYEEFLELVQLTDKVTLKKQVSLHQKLQEATTTKMLKEINSWLEQVNLEPRKSLEK